MKNLLILLLAASTAALGVLCVAQWRTASKQQGHIIALREEAEQKSSRLADLESARERSDQERNQLLALSADMAVKLRALHVAQTNAAVKLPSPASPDSPETKPGGFGKMLAGMMQDPEMKKFIRDQQRTMMDQLYSPLVKQMGLTAEEADAFKNLLADNMMKAAEKASSVFGGSSATNRSEVFSSLAAEQKVLDDEVKAFLGETRFEQYKDYQQTAGERTQLNLFKQQNAGSDHPLTETQTEQLLVLMKEEKANVASLTGQKAPGAGTDQANFEATLSEEQSEKFLTAQEAVNRRVYERAGSVLSPEQMQELARFQTNQLQMMRMGISMARKFMAPDQTSPVDQTR